MKVKKYYMKPCRTDKGGCGNKFRPTSSGSILCEDCLIEKRDNQTKIINLKSSKNHYAKIQAKSKSIRDGLNGIQI